jgi:uncharacterized membrane protein
VDLCDRSRIPDFTATLISTHVYDAPVFPALLSLRKAWAVVGAVAATCLYAAYGLHRHHRFGSGSWDMGCYLHNAWMFGHGEAFASGARSSVLGDVGFWGGENHFMPTLVLTGPLSWLMEWTGYTGLLIVVQAMVVAATIVAIDGYGRSLSLPIAARMTVSAAFAVHGGTMAFVGFDVHELAPIPLLMMSALWAARQHRWWAWWLCVLLLMGCKESAWLYGAALGVHLMLRGQGAAARRHGAATMIIGGIGFFVVTSVWQPAWSLPGDAMLHTSRFAALGPDLPSALLHVLAHPIDAMVLMVTPAIKAHTLMITLVGMGLLVLLQPRSWPLLLVVIVERMWSNKTEMWALGFHYSLVTVGVLAIAALEAMAAHQQRHRHAPSAMVICMVIGIIGQAWSSPHTAQLWSWPQPYFATDEQVQRYHRALATIRHDDDVVAQNHFLPHLALRAHIWQPHERFVDRATIVILDADASPWPHTKSHIAALIRRLRSDPRWRIVFEEQHTLVFRRDPS